MFARTVWLVCLACLGCQAVIIAPTARVDQPEARTPTEPAATSVPATASLVVPSSLDLAAAALDIGDNAQAALHLQAFVAAHPEQCRARLVYAELLVEHGHLDEAREQYLQLMAMCQRLGDVERCRLRACHAGLMALAQAADDEYEVQLQRGIGLLLLAEERARLGDPAGDVSVEGLLCKAAGCLTRAHALRRDEARPCWYLHEVWRQLGQPQQAARWLKHAQQTAPFSSLTPSEQHHLLLASTQA